MTFDELRETFEKNHDNFLKQPRVDDPRPSKRLDLCAFLRLEKMFPERTRDMVCAAAHDEIWLDVDVDELAAVATEEDVEYLVRCGVRLDADAPGLAMFV